jgi:RNA polymerase sigma-70 factor (ECF subfamily)
VATENQDLRRLIALSQQDDAESFCLLYRAYEARLFGQAAAFCGDARLAEDLAQEVFFQAWKSIHRYDGRCQFFTWLCAILLHRYRTVLGRKHPLALSTLLRGDRDTAQGLLDNLAEPSCSPDQAAGNSECAAFFLGCIQRLPKKHRDVVYLRFYVDNSLAGIAVALGCSVGTVKSRLFHALEKLRKMHGVRAHFEDQ